MAITEAAAATLHLGVLAAVKLPPAVAVVIALRPRAAVAAVETIVPAVAVATVPVAATEVEDDKLA